MHVLKRRFNHLYSSRELYWTVVINIV